MLDNILNLVKDKVSVVIDQNNEIPADKKENAIDLITSTLIDGFISNFTQENSSSLSGLFSGGSYDGLDLARNLQTLVISVLIEKIGISQHTANSVASAVVPVVINLLSDKVNDNSKSGSKLGSIIDDFFK